MRAPSAGEAQNENRSKVWSLTTAGAVVSLILYIVLIAAWAVCTGMRSSRNSESRGSYYK